ncbi:type I-C CRISPR-associated protein Cas8c/Csd1 [Dethiosulfatarculus sandiegensis]|uniref:CRISPR-associated protein Csd1 n=1 Tax=Dethiosulfatarculus sandiegensis TaxID=1429043 RepID=A0A0D2IYR3_9BACT|nr:type I-C CRISPR-associated protein Cas8c/Csd1 [Dethiosulfatarculus sandiegensis]KIX11179.1 CRISPR-associated protein Csd1 [Dethiosulfatarculus sandiegensis]
MIIQALDAYYKRLAQDPEENISLQGFSVAKILFALVLSPQGELVEVQDLRLTKGKRKEPLFLEVPEAVIRSAGISPNFLWDKTDYVLGAAAPPKNKEKTNPGKEAKDAQRAIQAFESFVELCHQVGDGLDDPGMAAVLTFLDSWNPEKAAELSLWEEMAGQNLVFRLDGARGFVHQSPTVRQAWLEHYNSKDTGAQGQCLVSGEIQPLEKTHPKIKGVAGGQPSGTSLVSFNLDAFKSYGKEQNLNSPISSQSAFNYTTALNRLLQADNERMVRIGETSVVFWTENKSPASKRFGMVLKPPQAEDSALNQELQVFLESLKAGKHSTGLEGENPFYALGLSPNSSRISVRFWLASTVAEMEKRLSEHFHDLELVRQWENESPYPSPWALLRETALQKKSSNISPKLSGDFTRAIITGQSYPRSLLEAVLERIRADQQVNYLRTALIKAYLSRCYRLSPSYRNNPNHMEVSMSLDKQSTDTAYRLGRLFAALEKLQRDALGTLNATIRDRYISSASATPKVAFPHLLRLAQAHMKKTEYAKSHDKTLGEIMDGIDAFPAHFTLEQQGQFFLGYYHQRKDFFTAKNDKESEG